MTSTGKFYALKKLLKNDLDGAKIENLKKQIEILKGNQHPNLISHSFVFQREHDIFLASPLVLGKTLEEFIEKLGEKTLEEE